MRILKQEAVFICIEGWCVGVTVASSHQSCTMGGHTNTHRDTITHTNEQNMYVRGYSPIVRRNVSICSFLFFCNMRSNTAKALTWPSFELFFSCISIPFQARLILIFMSLAWHAYYYSHYCYYAFRGRKITLGLAEAVQKQGAITAPIIGLVWFMIYADHIRPEITPLEALGCKKLF